MAVRKFKPVTPGQDTRLLARSRRLLHPCQRSLSFTENAQLVVETTPVR